MPYIDIHDLHFTVKDIVSYIGPHTQLLYTQLPPIMSKNINNIQFKFNDSHEDTFIWSSNKNGTYTTKNRYSWLLSRMDPVTHSNSNISWSWIWKLKPPKKIKFFIWLACHNLVPTLSLLNHINIALIANCFQCNLHEETFLHCLCDCHFSRIVRQCSGF